MRIFLMLVCGSGLFTLSSREDGDYRNLYAVNFFDGKTWDSTIVPPSSREIYLLANHEHALVLRETWLYYWPLTGEYRADWAVRNNPLEGTLVVDGLKGDIKRIPRDIYVIQHNLSGPGEQSSIYWGEEAVEAYETFKEQRNGYVLKMQQFNRAKRQHDAEIYELLRDKERTSTTYPEAPIEPSPFQLISTEPNYGYRIDLPVGTYRIVLETPDGLEAEETSKQLEIFAPMEIGVQGFMVFEEQRWTVPDKFSDTHIYLYSLPGASLYFQPYIFARFDHHAYTMMKNPQDPFTRKKLFEWIPIESDTSTETIAMGSDNLSLSGYRVDQIAGSRVGYSINRVSRQDKTASFAAARFDIGEIHARSSFRVGDSGILAVLGTGRSPTIELILIILCGIPLGVRGVIGIHRIRMREHNEL